MLQCEQEKPLFRRFPCPLVLDAITPHLLEQFCNQLLGLIGLRQGGNTSLAEYLEF